jgi:hypothetical protein
VVVTQRFREDKAVDDEIEEVARTNRPPAHSREVIEFVDLVVVCSRDLV